MEYTFLSHNITGEVVDTHHFSSDRLLSPSLFVSTYCITFGCTRADINFDADYDLDEDPDNTSLSLVTHDGCKLTLTQWKGVSYQDMMALL